MRLPTLPLMFAAVLACGMAAGAWLASPASVLGEQPDEPLAAAASAGVNTAAHDPAHRLAMPAALAALKPGFPRAHAAHQWLAGMNESALKHAFTAVSATPDAMNRRLLASVFYRRYLELNPAAAIHHFGANVRATDPLHEPLLTALCDTWLDLDASAATAHVAHLGDARLRQRVVRALLAARDPNGAEATQLLALLGGDERDAMRLERQLALEPGRAFHALLAQAPSPQRSGLLREAFIAFVLASPAQALGQIDRLPPDDRQEVASAALAMLAEQRPKEVLGLMQHVTDTPQRYLAGVVGAVALHHPQQALDWLRQNPGLDPQGELLTAAIPGLVRHSPAMAAEAVASMRERAPSAAIQQVAVALARQDPRQAHEWVQGFAQGRSARSAARVVNGFGASWAASQPNQAASYLARVSDPQLRGTLIREIAVTKGQDDLRGAWQWLSQYSTEPAYAESARNLLYRWSYVKPEDVASLLPHVTRSDVQSAAAQQLAQLWQQKDASAYAAWHASLPEGALKAAASMGH